MPLEKDELKALSENSPKEIREVLSSLSPEEISELYDLEVAKETPRTKVTDMLMAETNNINTDDEGDKVEKPKKGVLNKSLEYNMIWHKGTKCILQNNTIYDRVTGEKIKSVK